MSNDIGQTEGETTSVDPSVPDYAPAPGSAASSGQLVPGWLRRLGALSWRILVSVAMGAVLIGIAATLSTVTTSVLFAGVVVAAVSPLQRTLRARGWTAGKAAAVVSAIGLGAILVVSLVIAAAFVPYVADLLRAIEQGIADLNGRLDRAGVPAEMVTLVDRATDALTANIAGTVAQLVAPIATTVTVFILGGFLVFYLLEGGDRAWAVGVRELDEWREEVLTARARLTFERVGGYLRAIAVTAAIDGVAGLAIVTILDLPLAGPLAVTMFIGGLVPYLGPLVATSIVVLVALTTGGFLPAAAVIGAVLLVKIAQRQWLGRFMFERAAGIHPVVVLVALPLGAALFGFIGVIGAVPAVLFTASLVPTLTRTLDTRWQATDAQQLVPTWLDRVAQWSWRGLVVFGVVALIGGVAVGIPGLTVPVVLALVLAATFQPGVDALAGRRMPRAAAALLVTVASAFAVVVAVALAIGQIGTYASEVVRVAGEGAGRLPLGSTPAALVTSAGRWFDQVLPVLTDIAAILLAVVFGTLLTFFFLRDGPAWGDRIANAVGDTRRADLVAAGSRATKVLNGYMVGTGVISLFAAVTQWLIMVLLGLPLAFPIAVLTFFGNFIPYIGGLVTTLLGFLVAVAAGSPTDILLMGIYTLVINIVQGNFVAPVVYGRAVSLHPAIVLLAIPAGGQVAGIIGMFLVVPFLGVVATTWRLVLHLFDPEGIGGALRESSPAPAVKGPATPPVARTATGT